jgi:hypothetical protein
LVVCFLPGSNPIPRTAHHPSHSVRRSAAARVRRGKVEFVSRPSPTGRA